MDVTPEKPSQNDQNLDAHSDNHRDNEFSEDVPIDFENEADDAYRVQPGRVNFRRENAPPRFRPPNFGGSNQQFPPMRGRGGNHNFFRGNRSGGPPRFGHQNFDPNFGPGMMGHQAPMMNQPLDLFVETKTSDGKSYFYHAVTRETTWTRPEGPNVKVMTQSEVEAMQSGKAPPDGFSNSQPNINPKNESADEKPPQNGEAATESSSNQTQATTENKDPQFVPPSPVSTNNSTISSVNPNPTQTNHFNAPPPFSYGMPPPGYMSYPGNTWQAPWQQHQHQPPPMNVHEPPAKNLISKPGIIDPQVIARAAEWSEHRAPDGRLYYYHAGRGESVWEKPQAIRDLEAARMAAHSGVPAFPPPMFMPPMGNPAMVGMHGQLAPGIAPLDGMGFPIKTGDKDGESAEAKEKKRKLEVERKKKEEDEKAKQNVAKQDKSRPVSSTPIAGTPWCVVWTGDGRVFFYNPSSRTSVWERPEELVGRPDVDKVVSTAPGKDEKDDNPEKPKINALDENAAIEVETNQKEDSESSGENEDVPNKKIKLDEAQPIANSTVPKVNERKQDNGKETAIEAEVRAARERALVPLETRVTQFKEMLKEKDVSAFSTWEKELHKIVFDPRYLLLTSRERKQVFEKYVKERAEEERREKRNKMRQKRDDFRSLMEAAHLHGKSSFSDFAQKYGKDERFKGIEKMRDREGLFNEYILEVRRREKDEKNQKKETIRKDFLALLREHNEITRHSRWPDVKKRIDSDSRYRAVDGSNLREDYFIEYCKILKEERRKQKDKDHDRKSRKDKHRDKDRRDKDGKKEKRDSSDRGRSTEKSSKNKESDKDDIDQEEGEHPPSSDDDESERAQRERERQLRAEQSIKEREKEVQLQLADHMRHLHKERAHHKRDEAIRAFSALLADLVRNADLTWKEVKKQLRKDHRWESVEQLERDDRERIFNDHILQLSNKKRDKFREMLDELPSFDLTASWKEIKKQIRDDPRYLKYNSSEKCEREFREYIRDKTNEAKNAFKELLQECKLITYKSFETVKENSAHTKEIENILKNDKRFLVLDHIQQDRSQILMIYLEDLHKRGPPPPPTASESTRRK